MCVYIYICIYPRHIPACPGAFGLPRGTPQSTQLILKGGHVGTAVGRQRDLALQLPRTPRAAATEEQLSPKKIWLVDVGGYRLYTYIYIYIYIERERERERNSEFSLEKDGGSFHIFT